MATELLQPRDLACGTLPVQLRNPDITYGLFRRQLKGHLFREARTQRSVISDMRHHRKKHLFTYPDVCPGHLSHLQHLLPDFKRTSNHEPHVFRARCGPIGGETVCSAVTVTANGHTATLIYYFASTAVALDSSHMTALSSTSWNRFSPMGTWRHTYLNIIKRSSVRPSVCPAYRQQQQRAAGGFAAEVGRRTAVDFNR